MENRPMWCGESSRKIRERVVVEAKLVLKTPAHLGNGDGNDLVDMPLLLDSVEAQARPLLTGASLAGALRSYLWSRQRGSRTALPNSRDAEKMQEARETAAVLLFGGLKSDDEGEQSPLIVDDALGELGTFGAEIREGVAISPQSRTAVEKKLFNGDFWQAGTTFPIRLELVIRERDCPNAMKQALATALQGLRDGEIRLGARKRRGFGEFEMRDWRVRCYDLTKPDGSDLLDWLEHGDAELSETCPTDDLQKSLGVEKLIDDTRCTFTLRAQFSLDGSLLIRSGSGRDDHGPDMVHLHSKQLNGDQKPILSGTSLAGALRARSLKIAKTIAADDRQQVAERFVESIWGTDMDKLKKRREANPKLKETPIASRVEVQESTVSGGRADLVQNRVSLDRFTGGARDTALFNEQPVFGGDDTTVCVDLTLVNPDKREIGLVLLLLKDLWTGDLPLGGGSSVGRGRLKGVGAQLTWRSGDPEKHWTIHQQGETLDVPGDDDAREAMEKCVKALNNHLKGVPQ